MEMNIPRWHLLGDWFDVCNCNIPCPCTFAQAPSYGDCEGVLAYHIKNGRYSEISLDGLNVLAVSDFKGNIWAGNTKANIFPSIGAVPKIYRDVNKVILNVAK
jgi:hypothetical protein